MTAISEGSSGDLFGSISYNTTAAEITWKGTEQRELHEKNPMRCRSNSGEDIMRDEPSYVESNIKSDHTGRRFVIRESYLIRKVWNIVLAVILIYTATFFIFRVAFIENHVPEPLKEINDRWLDFEWFIDGLFWIDLFMGFLFSYKDHTGREIDSLRLIAQKYVKGYFIINLIACLPAESLEWWLFPGKDDDKSVNKFARIVRVQRCSKLVRLMTVKRWFTSSGSSKQTKAFWRWFSSLRGVRVVNLVFGLIWIVHLIACGWYICAAFHLNPDETWLARRVVGPWDGGDGTLLLHKGPGEQWCNAMYFVLTVFTTVGFGDMYPVTTGEIAFVSACMLIGAVIHSILISEVISIITTADQGDAFFAKQTALVDAFSKHTRLDESSQYLLRDWIASSAKNWAHEHYDLNEMQALITGRQMPRWLMGRLPHRLFGGDFIRNKIFAMQHRGEQLPPRLPLLMSIVMHTYELEERDIVYQKGDTPFTLFMIMRGTCACVGKPGRYGGSDAGTHAVDNLKGISKAFKVADPSRPANSESAKKKPLGAIGGALWRAISRSKSLGESSLQSSEHLEQTIQNSIQDYFYPYKLYCGGNFFGEYEIIFDEPQRCCTVRCESKSSLLSIHRQDLANICKEFPQFQQDLRSMAASRENRRHYLLEKLTRRMGYKHFAASLIQSTFRSKWYGPTTKDAAEPSKSRSARRPLTCGISTGTLSNATYSENNVRGGVLSNATYSEKSDSCGPTGEKPLVQKVRELAGEVEKLNRGLVDLRVELRAEVRSAVRDALGNVVEGRHTTQSL